MESRKMSFSDEGEKERLIHQLENYVPFNEQEEKDRREMLRRMKMEELFLRDNNSAHFSASAWVISPDFSQVLLCFHRIYQSWSWLGGHCDGDRNPLRVAVREVKEESGLQVVTPVSEQIFSLEILTVNGHEKKGEYVSSHLHLNLTYLLKADPSAPLHHCDEENTAVRWFSAKEAADASSEPWMRERIYQKLNEKMKRFM